MEVGFRANEAKCCKKVESNSGAVECCLENYFYTCLLILELEVSGNLCGVSVFVLLWAQCPPAFAFCVCEMELLCSENKEDVDTVITSTPGQTWNKTIF